MPFARGKIKDVDGNNVSVIFTDKENPIAVYTEKNDITGEYDDDFAIALSYRVAYFAAPRVTGGDPFQLQRAALGNLA